MLRICSEVRIFIVLQGGVDALVRRRGVSRAAARLGGRGRPPLLLSESSWLPVDCVQVLRHINITPLRKKRDAAASRLNPLQRRRQHPFGSPLDVRENVAIERGGAATDEVVAAV